MKEFNEVDIMKQKKYETKLAVFSFQEADHFPDKLQSKSYPGLNRQKSEGKYAFTFISFIN